MALSALIARRRPVSMTERMSGASLAPHSVRNPLVIFRNTAQGRKTRWEPLLVAGRSRLVMNTMRYRLVLLDHASQFDAGRVRRLARHEFIELRIELRGIGLQRRVDDPCNCLALIEPQVRLGPSPRNFAADASYCIMVRIPGSNRIQIDAAR